ncbi:hypothetical protein [Leptothrix discophora]|uniref:Uncharacterized protein n=1 Tax=Leptothrix discophora TaxID=89 RepID=A0ABT9G1T4_LEPDI|nr:hypothetical protein [Leptothrix discophora]MDP4300459.1 hypothetical protein [Leptothrix discophora]
MSIASAERRQKQEAAGETTTLHLDRAFTRPAPHYEHTGLNREWQRFPFLAPLNGTFRHRS